MKALITGLLAVALLAGCVAVPYEPAPAGYYYGPPATVQFNYGYYRGGPRHYHHRHW
jgi:hypothetical protein